MISSSLASNESGTLVIDVEDSDPPVDSSEDSNSARSSSGMLSDIPESEIRNKQTNKQTNVTHIHGPVAAVNAHTLKASGSVTQLESQLL